MLPWLGEFSELPPELISLIALDLLLGEGGVHLKVVTSCLFCGGGVLDSNIWIRLDTLGSFWWRRRTTPVPAETAFENDGRKIVSELFDRLLINLGLGIGELDIGTDVDSGGCGLDEAGLCLTGVVLLATRVNSLSLMSTMLLTLRTTLLISSFRSGPPPSPTLSPFTTPASIKSVLGGLGGGTFFLPTFGDGHSCMSECVSFIFLSSTLVFSLSLCEVTDFEEMYDSCFSLLMVTSSCVGSWSSMGLFIFWTRFIPSLGLVTTMPSKRSVMESVRGGRGGGTLDVIVSWYDDSSSFPSNSSLEESVKQRRGKHTPPHCQCEMREYPCQSY